ncbi:MAG: hypothetical protein ACYDDF_11270 [Thermoplasmatota archaeon]
MVRGSYVWISTDHGHSFSLTNSPDLGQESTGSCICDTDLSISQNTIDVVSMYWSVNPVFNLAFMASDGGDSFTLRQPSVATHPPVDRPWVTATSATDALVVYQTTGSYWDAVNLLGPSIVPSSLGSIWLDITKDGGTTWSERLLVPAPNVKASFARAGKPIFIAPATLVIPLYTLTLNATGKLQEADAILLSHDGGGSFSQIDIASTHPLHATFDFSIAGTTNGTMVATWIQPGTEGTDHLFARTSKDAGRTWGPPAELLFTGTQEQPAAAVRPDGSTAIAFYATNSSGPIAQEPANTTWFPRVVILDPALRPVVTAQLATHPVLNGILCNFGDCPANDTRSLLREFLSVQWYVGGVYVAYTDAGHANATSDPLLAVTQVEYGGPG